MTATLLLALLAMNAAPVLGPPPPVLVMVRTPGPPAFERTEQRLHEELTLLLDSFMVLATPLEAPDFPRLPLAQQLAAVLPVSKANDAVAVVWLAEPMPGQLMLHLVAMSTGRTLVRTLEFDRRSQSEGALALMLRELLGTAFLFEPPQAVEAALRPVVKAVRGTLPASPEVAPAPAPPPSPPRHEPVRSRRRLQALGLLEAGVAGGVLDGPHFGGGVQGDLPLGPLQVGATVECLAATARLPGGPALSSAAVPVALTATLPLGHPFTLGPRLALGVEPTWLSASGSQPSGLFLLGPWGAAGLEAVGGVGPLRLLFRAELVARSRLAEVLEFPQGSIQWRRATLGLRAGLGVSWEGW